MKVAWQLDRTDTCRLAWGTDAACAAGSTRTVEHGADHQHAFTITGLHPDRTVFYRMIAGADTFAASFRTAPSAAATRACFLAYGDTRSQPEIHDRVAEAMLAAAAADPCLRPLVAVVGDLVGDGNSEAAWDKEFFSPSVPHLRKLLAEIPYASCMGNHERSGALYAKYFPYPFHAARYWSFDYGPVHFVVVDQFTDFAAGSAQYAWMQADLTSTGKRWRFVVLHEPGWSAGGGHANNVTVQRDIQPLCRRYGVRRLAVFRSVSRGEDRPGSDLDLLVELEPEARTGLAFFRLQDELAALFGRPVDLNTPGFLSPRFRDKVMHASRPLYVAA